MRWLLLIVWCFRACGNQPQQVPDSKTPLADTTKIAADTLLPPRAFVLSGTFQLFYTGSDRSHPVYISIDSTGHIIRSKVYGRIVLESEPPCKVALFKKSDSLRADSFTLRQHPDGYFVLKALHSKKSFDLLPLPATP